jgi:hypothetical protein
MSGAFYSLVCRAVKIKKLLGKEQRNPKNSLKKRPLRKPDLLTTLSNSFWRKRGKSERMTSKESKLLKLIDSELLISVAN